ncbi:MAG: DUF692 domain-containing protein [Chloroflexi bacterium]|nr:DUF692 domain-containing protein [Chloroflexota bacterium]
MGSDWLHECLQRQKALLHCNDSLVQSSFDPSNIVELAHITRTEWVSLHLDVPRTRLFNYWKRSGIPFPIISQGRGRKLAVDNVRLLQQYLPIPVAIENQAYHRRCGHDYLVKSDFISSIIEATNCWLLLDLGHARVSAAMLDTSEQEYIASLPLDRVIEIHISGPESYRGRLRDVHGPLKAKDYHLLQHILPQCPQCRAVTLEYYGPAAQLEKQLHELRRILEK